MNSKKSNFSNSHLNLFGDKRIRPLAQRSRRERMFMKMFLGVLIICSLVVPASADTVIEYTLDGDWIYEQKYVGTLSLTDNPSGGITANINVPNGIDDGGLTASRHDLPGFSIANDGFIELYYSSLTSTITGDADFSLCLEVEFYDEYSSYEIAIVIGQSGGSSNFETWFIEDSYSDFDYYYEEPIPDGLLMNESALGLYSHDSFVSPYFKDVEGNLLYPFSDCDISEIGGMDGFRVDNDFEAWTSDDGTVNASVNLRQVVYGPGHPVPIPGTVWLLGAGLAGLAGIRTRRK